MYFLGKKQAIIYGTGIAGRKVCELLEENGIIVKAFIDKRYQEIEVYMDKPVLGMAGVSEILDKDQYTIIITIKNVYDHSEIADQLLKYGFHNIICKPYDILQGRRGKHIESVDEAYEALIDRCQMYFEPIESFETVLSQNLDDDGFISAEGEYVRTYIDATLLFTNQKKDTEWDSLNFVSTFPGVEMYFALDNQRLCKQNKIFKEFTDYCAEGAIKGGIELSKSWEKNIIENRSNIFGEMKRMYSLRKEFFVENCPTFEYLEKGKLRIISSGKNRVAFLISQGDWYIPVRIRKDHYQKYINLEQAMVVHNLIANAPIWCSIPHPMFYGRKVIAYNYLDAWVPNVGRYISDYVKWKVGIYDFTNIYIEDYSDDDGTISRHLRRMGCRVGRKTERTKLCEEVDKLFGFDEKDFQLQKQLADISILTCIKTEHVEREIFDENRQSKMQFVLLSENMCVDQLIYTQSQDRKKQLIFESVWGGRKVAGYIINKEE